MGVQCPHQLLPTAEMGTAQQENPVSIRTLAVVALIAGGATGIVQSAVNQLDQATAQQCLTRDWPVYQHAAHMDFCTSYGYPTN